VLSKGDCELTVKFMHVNIVFDALSALQNNDNAACKGYSNC